MCSLLTGSETLPSKPVSKLHNSSITRVNAQSQRQILLKQYPISYINSFIYKRRKNGMRMRKKNSIYHHCGGRCRAELGNPFIIFQQRVMLLFSLQLYGSGSEELCCFVFCFLANQMIPLHFSKSQFQGVMQTKPRNNIRS